EREAKFEIAHAAYRLCMSACFAAGKMTCTTCHNPHSVPRGPEAGAHYESVCKSCDSSAHASEPPAKTACLDCHMPKLPTDGAVTVVMTDHYIQRRKPARDLLSPLAEAHDLDEEAYRGEVAPYYPASAENELYVALAQVQHSSNLAVGTPR